MRSATAVVLRWVCVDIGLATGDWPTARSPASPAHCDRHDDLRVRFDGWLSVRALAQRGEPFFSINGYGVLLRPRRLGDGSEVELTGDRRQLVAIVGGADAPHCARA